MPVGLGAVADPYAGIPTPEQFAEGSSPFMDLGTPYLAYVVEEPAAVELAVEAVPTVAARPRWLYVAGGIVSGAAVMALLLGRSNDQVASSSALPLASPIVEIAVPVAAPVAPPVVAPKAPEAARVEAPKVERAGKRIVDDGERAERNEPKDDAPSAAPIAASKKAAALMTQYQRIGRELMLLQREVGPEVAADLVSQFKSIQIEEASATPEAREECAETLSELHKGIERRKPIKISDECMNNPLAKDCQ